MKFYGKLTKKVLIIIGFFFVGIGIIGIFLPLLPTTPFFLLAAVCFARSSERFHNWLLNHRLFGRYVKGYQGKERIPAKIKIFTICLLWVTIVFSGIIFFRELYIRVILFFIAIGVSIHILSIRPVERNEKRQDNRCLTA